MRCAQQCEGSKELTKNVRLDDGTSDIDSLDSFEYTLGSGSASLLNMVMKNELYENV